MGLVHENLPTAAIYENPQQMLGLAVGLIAVGGAALKIVETVPDGEMGILMRNSTSPVVRKEVRHLPEDQRIAITDDRSAEIGQFVILGPGRYLVAPLFRKVVKINVGDRADTVKGLALESEEGQQYEAHPTFTWHVRRDGDNPWKARFRVNNEKDNRDKDRDLELKQAVIGICVDGLSQVLNGMPADRLIKLSGKDVIVPTQEICRDDLLYYGVGLRRVGLEPIRRTFPEVIAQSGQQNASKIIIEGMEADEDGMGAVIPFPNPRDAA
jgi:hypothetical protein